MSYLLVCCFLLALVNLSAHLQIKQMPRFIATRPGSTLKISCLAVDGSNVQGFKIKWYKAKEHNGAKHLLSNPRATSHANRTIIIHKLEPADSGIYYCKLEEYFGFGTELQVLRRSDAKAKEWRSNMKDFIIFLQGFLIVLCTVLPMIWYYKLDQKEDAVYEEPEHDHTYEGLAIEHCGDLYEDIRPYQEVPQGPEAAWEVESPEDGLPIIESP